jgi:hypothetical protein
MAVNLEMLKMMDQLEDHFELSPLERKIKKADLKSTHKLNKAMNKSIQRSLERQERRNIREERRSIREERKELVNEILSYELYITTLDPDLDKKEYERAQKDLRQAKDDYKDLTGEEY